MMAATSCYHYCKPERKCLKSLCLQQCQSHLSALGHLIFLQGKQLECTGMKINVQKVFLPFTCGSCVTGKWLINNI